MSDDHLDDIAASYEAVPYRDKPYVFTHPRHLEAMAVLFGMDPPPIDRCRVLEIGCAGGGNLIPQALDLPESTFLGIDLSPRQIAQGEKIVELLGLRNIELRPANLMDVDAGWGQFDYIISHGVFSWVPPGVQEKLLEISDVNLAPQGVAFVSYNAYPGWRLASMARDMMCYHAAQFEDPQQKIAQAKAFLEFLIEVGREDRAATKALKEELELLRKVNNDEYVFHEHLEPENWPVYFHEFIRRAEAKGLQYLAEAEFSIMLPRNLPEKAREMFSRLPLIQAEQYMDFVRFRRFRQTLLCHRSVPLVRRVAPERMKRFHFTFAGDAEMSDVDIRNEQPAEFRARGSTLTVTSPLAKAALVYLREARPGYVSFGELYLAALGRLGASAGGKFSPHGADADTLAASLLAAYSVGMLRVCVHPPRCLRHVSQRPAVSHLARFQAEANNWVTSPQHEAVPLNPLGRRLVRRLDGAHDRPSLGQCVEEAVAAGEMIVRSKGDERVLEQLGPATVAEILDKELTRIASAGLLIG